ncbi:leucyl aminopeptidase family protein [Streptomyces scabiei]|uniref:leucyl aminopeptidase family protein n=1 Tax=Streptomyces scabiei TaxID=1930 RepID=UPI001B30924F|nr:MULTISPECIES: leucyl aminopeptidase family protein [Streptomyces]MBP5863416.1 leucyl aminopeptidase family protein [Streptomyces sp. LBUM 1484]MBP5876081.1 leucyl aminopeptidase family protein [Streptomyces sp. LBUM 1477]MBP5883813.1 leucyl aminopeptidase family protein [Streptomyces sp. LBUM 1487]MBP5899832.1 leucyl aminopeptidase family protein [Streptomyces sp. LBUM 1488]MDX2537360.1 leucyl aminopeptidase family protein [Streptomyces scabiei]
MTRVVAEDVTARAADRPADVVAYGRHTGAAVGAFSRRRGFVARPGQVVAEPSADGGAVVLNVGLGPAGAATAATFRTAAAGAVRAAGPARTLRLELALADESGVPAADRALAVAEGAVLGLYRYDEYRSARAASPLAEVVVVTGERRAAAEGLAAAEATCLARDLVNRPAGDLTPPVFADRIRELAHAAGLGCAVYEPAGLTELGLTGLAAVGRGSAEPPRYVELTYDPPGGEPVLTVGLVGKGVTFDSGGLSLKPSDERHAMKADMAGAAAVVAALTALPPLGLPLRIRGHLPLAENMPDGGALRVGDVVTHLDGTTTEITHTDNEGRVVLADVLVRASGPGPDRADLVIDVATLTSAAVHALGTRTAVLFTPDERLARTVLAASERAGESFCRLPLLAHERRHLRSAVADRVNCSHRHGDTVQAALFLQDFVAAGVRWAHLDIAAPAYNDEGPYAEVPYGGTGFAVRTLIETLRALGA